jgi:indole-3-glycerol phosphate synthase
MLLFYINHLHEKRKRRRPKETLRRTIEREAKTIGLKTQDLQDLATNRKEWKTMTSALFAKLGTRGI